MKLDKERGLGRGHFLTLVGKNNESCAVFQTKSPTVRVTSARNRHNFRTGVAFIVCGHPVNINIATSKGMICR